MRLSMHALLHDMPVVWHGDPHAGNIYMDGDGNIGFLDMGLVFRMSPEDAALTRELFLCAFLGLADRLYHDLEEYLKPGQDRGAFHAAICGYCKNRQGKPLSSFFVDMMLVCFRFDFEPPGFLFRMAKAFAALGGADMVYGSDTGSCLVAGQVDRYLVCRCVDWWAESVEGILGGGHGSLSMALQKWLGIAAAVQRIL